MATTVLASIGDHGVLNAPLSPALPEVWIDRDLSWLDFNWRVLAEALDERTPLLERAKFLAIFTSNLDEFFMKRETVLRHGATDAQRALLQQVREKFSFSSTARRTATARSSFRSRGPRSFLTPLGRPHTCSAKGSRQVFRLQLSPALTPLVIDPSPSFSLSFQSFYIPGLPTARCAQG